MAKTNSPPKEKKNHFFWFWQGDRQFERVRVFDFAFQTEVLIKLQSKLQTPDSSLRSR